MKQGAYTCQKYPRIQNKQNQLKNLVQITDTLFFMTNFAVLKEYFRDKNKASCVV